MPNKKLVPVKYTNRDFETIKSDLVEYAKRYYSDTFKDFSEASFGALMLDTVAYVGDILSFYLDYQANESFIDTAIDYDNVLRHGQALGYKFKQNQSSYGITSFYILIPASTTGLSPDEDYLPVLKRGSKLESTEGTMFTLNDNVSFSGPATETVVARVDPENGLPTYYAIKAKGQVVSGEHRRETIGVGEFQRFIKVRLSNPSITEIISVTDSEGHEYFEVEHLSQNIIYKPVVNRNEDKDYAPAIMKPFVVPRRFTVDQKSTTTNLQFGYGSDFEISNDSIADPSEVILNVHGKDYMTDNSFDPTKLINTDKFGIAPANTTLLVKYRTNQSNEPNASAGSINTVITPEFEFDNRSALDEDKVLDVIKSVEVINEDPIIGAVTTPDIEELKYRIKSSFASQNRAVTREDYISVIYSMPPKFGSVKRATIIQDTDSFRRRNLNIYVISEDNDRNLIKTNKTIKENVRTWITKHKMINDTIDILDAKIINIGIEFVLVSDIGTNKYDALTLANAALRKYLKRSYYIGEPLLITDIYKTLNNVEGVSDTIDVNVVAKNGTSYSNIEFNIFDNMTPDGRALFIPDDHILEVKFPLEDIKGAVK